MGTIQVSGSLSSSSALVRALRLFIATSSCLLLKDVQLLFCRFSILSGNTCLRCLNFKKSLRAYNNNKIANVLLTNKKQKPLAWTKSLPAELHHICRCTLNSPRNKSDFYLSPDECLCLWVWVLKNNNNLKLY